MRFDLVRDRLHIAEFAVRHPASPAVVPAVVYLDVLYGKILAVTIEHRHIVTQGIGSDPSRVIVPCTESRRILPLGALDSRNRRHRFCEILESAHAVRAWGEEEPLGGDFFGCSDRMRLGTAMRGQASFAREGNSGKVLFICCGTENEAVTFGRVENSIFGAVIHRVVNGMHRIYLRTRLPFASVYRFTIPRSTVRARSPAKAVNSSGSSIPSQRLVKVDLTRKPS